MARGMRQSLVARKAAWKLDLDNTNEDCSASIVVTRNLLKSELMYDRGELTAVGWLPICPICDEPVMTPDMHEAIITRDDIQGLSVMHQMKIFVRENCVLVHPGQCHIEAATEEGARKCILHLVEKEGLMAILEWLAVIKGALPKELLNEAIHLIQHFNKHSTIQARTMMRSKIR